MINSVGSMSFRGASVIEDPRARQKKDEVARAEAAKSVIAFIDDSQKGGHLTAEQANALRNITVALRDVQVPVIH